MTQAGGVEKFTREFSDDGISGAVLAAKRPGFGQLLCYIREGDTLHVYAVDRLGRDALDVQSTVRALLDKGVIVHVQGLGTIGRGVGELILAVLAQVADMERHRILERVEAGRSKARESLAETGLTHKGKASMGRPNLHDAVTVAQWRLENGASITKTAEHFGCSAASVKRYCAAAVDDSM
jgi:putative DNA-invertase from lambdoid prophage Rac